MQNKLFTECQSDFIPGDSCVAQLLSITHEIYKSFDCNPPADTRGIFLDISEVFDKVWHEGLIFKLKTYGIDDDLLKLLITKGCIEWTNFFLEKYFSWCPSRLRFGSYFIPNLHKWFTWWNKVDLQNFYRWHITVLKIKDENYSTIELNDDLKIISNWAFQWKMLYNPDPNKQAVETLFSKKHEKDN